MSTPTTSLSTRVEIQRPRETSGPTSAMITGFGCSATVFRFLRFALAPIRSGRSLRELPNKIREQLCVLERNQPKRGIKSVRLFLLLISLTALSATLAPTGGQEVAA